MLITNTNTITEEIDNPDPVQVEDVAKLWRGIFKSRQVPHENISLTSCQSTRSTVRIWRMMKAQG